MQRRENLALELGATCASCDSSTRATKGQEGKAWCNRKSRLVSTNGVCTSYSKTGVTLVTLHARKIGEARRVKQTNLFGGE